MRSGTGGGLGPGVTHSLGPSPWHCRITVEVPLISKCYVPYLGRFGSFRVRFGLFSKFQSSTMDPFIQPIQLALHPPSHAGVPLYCF